MNIRNEILTEDFEQIRAKPDIPWERLEGASVLVTGVAGFLAAYLTDFFFFLNNETNAKIAVIGLARNADRFKNRFGEARAFEQVVIQDVADPLLLNHPVRFIIHAASPASPKFYGRDPVNTIRANAAGTYEALMFAQRVHADSALIFSSGEVYGQVPEERIPIREDEMGAVPPLDVRSCYAESKRLAENLCVAFHHQHGVPAKIVRPFHTYGPGMDLNDGRVFCDFVRDLVEERPLTLKSRGTAKRPYCYLADATEAFLRVLLLGLPGTAYNVGNPEQEVSVLELAEKLCGLFPEQKTTIQYDLSAVPAGYLESPIRRNSPDIEKMRGLGWKPKTDIETGFRRTVRSYR